MKLEIITQSLDNWKRLGIQMKPNSDEVGWLIIFKRKLINNFFEKFSEIVDDTIYQDQLAIKKLPYTILEFKVSKGVFERGFIVSDQDYLLKRQFYFAEVDEVIEFIKFLNYDLSDVKWLTDLIYID